MPYIPKEHEKYDLLPHCRKDGGEVFEYPGGLLYKTEKLICSNITLMPYNYESYDEYFNMIDSLIDKYADNAEIVFAHKIINLSNTTCATVFKRNYAVCTKTAFYCLEYCFK